jgi:hypothetical protein
MADTVVTSSTNTVVLGRENYTTVLDGKKPVVILSGQLGPPGKSSLSLLDDVDIAQKTADSILMYDEDTGKWKPSKKLESHLVNAGFF